MTVVLSMLPVVRLNSWQFKRIVSYLREALVNPRSFRSRGGHFGKSEGYYDEDTIKYLLK